MNQCEKEQVNVRGINISLTSVKVSDNNIEYNIPKYKLLHNHFLLSCYCRISISVYLVRNKPIYIEKIVNYIHSSFYKCTCIG